MPIETQGRGVIARPRLPDVGVLAGSSHLPELSRVVSRTGPKRAWLSQMRAVSKIAGGR
jgi:hypothetical protein